MKIILKNISARNRNDAISKISDVALENGITNNNTALFEAFLEREKQSSTGFEKGVAIPHARISEITETAIIISRFAKPIDWKSLDNGKTDFAIAICVKKDDQSSNNHMEILSKISSLLIYDENIAIFKNGSITDIKKLINSKKIDIKNEKNKTKYDFLAVTSCITGVAHTNMAAESILKFAKENNLNVKVERQGAQGPLTPISDEDVKKSDYILLAIDKPIEGMDRFRGKKVLKTKTIDTMKNMKKVFSDLKKSSKMGEKIPNKKSGLFKANEVNSDKPVKLMQAIMNGLSYMIPIIIVGGLFLAFGLGIGRTAIGGDVTKHPGSIWYTIFQIGVVGIQLSVVVLSGFIANALGGRMVIAPAMILAFAAQGIGMGETNSTFFNYETLEFGVKGSNLSFFGAIASGLICGYGGFYWNKFLSPKISRNLKTIEPIIIVPILFVLIGWLLFSFALYLPLYYLSVGLDKGVQGLVDLNLMWIAGAIGGAMLCFDLGGPVNKIAFGLGVALIDSHPEVMGAIAAAGAVAPFGMAIGWLIGKKVFKLKHFQNDELAKESFIPALFMGFLGISEGAIPYAIKYPKSAIISNVLGGAIAGTLSGIFLISDSAAHTGPIVYILGAIGKNGETSYAYGLLYILAWVIGLSFTAISFPTIEWLLTKRKMKKEKLKNIKIKK